MVPAQPGVTVRGAALHVPAQPGAPTRDETLVVRPRLIAAADAGAPLTVLRGPAGSGAGVLLEQWLAAGGVRETRLVRVDGSGAGDVTSLLAALRVAVDPLVVGGATRSTGAGLPAARALLRGLGPTTLVVERLAPAPPQRDLLLLDLLRAVPGLRVVLTTRYDTVFDTGGPAQVGVRVIGPRDLALTHVEARELAVMLGSPLSPDQVDVVVDELGGWVAPVRAVLASDAAAAEGVHRQDRYDWDAATPPVLAALADLEPAVATAALHLALVDEIDATAIAALGVDVDAVPRLVRAGLLGVAPEGVVYPPSVRRALARRLLADDPDIGRDLHRRLVDTSTDAGELHRALAHAIVAEDWERAIEVLDAQPVALLCHHFPVVHLFLTRVPTEVLEGRATLALARSFLVRVLVTDGTAAAGTVLGAAPTAPLRPPTVRDRLAPALTQVITLRTLGHLDEAEVIAAKAQQLLPDPGYADAHDDVIALVRLQWGILRLLRGDLVAAAEDFRLAAQAANRTGIDFLTRNAAGDLALVHTLRGSLGSAQEWLDEVDALPPLGGYLERLSRTGWTVARALVALGRLDVDAAAETLDDLDALDDVHMREELWAFAEVAHVQLAVMRGDTLTALHRLEEQIALHPATCGQGTYLGAVVGCLRVDLLLALGHGNRARVALGTAPGSSVAMRCAPGAATGVRLRRARVDLLTGDASNARTHAVSVAHASGVHTRHLLDALLIEAVAEHRMGDDTAALAAVTRAVEVADSEGLVQPFALVPSVDLREIAGAVTPGAGRTTLRAVRRVLDLLDSPALREHGDALPSRVDVVDLSERERAVLVELATTSSLELIAARLFVSTNTVKSQVRSLYRKLGVHNRDDALVAAYRIGLLAD
ncbi:LuxR C-terminal-related transcriptional regulator [Cellulomonas sp. P22]|uniref:helix-turn-helix transcriptional regulator n=1 Tax=Cellulomonas sp. P22 TaxID=3373189 RepID=UPI00379AADFC